MTRTKERAESLTPMEHRMLERAVAILWPESNVAPGTHGAAIHELAQRGLMSVSVQEAGLGYMWEYRVTASGRLAYLSYGAPHVPISR